ncbi:hypothetical protein TURU_144694 [Turdus rufiventris]|nr:hypothetical protein TURU_144694 [Turdus rufiventris]
MCSTLHLALLNFTRFAKVNLSSLSSSCWMVSLPSAVFITQLGVISKPDKDLLMVDSIPLSRSSIRLLNRTGPNPDPWKKTSGDWSPTGCSAIHHCSLDLAIQPGVLLSITDYQLFQECAVGDGVKGFVKV